MFKWLLVIALTASIALCTAAEWMSQRTLAERRAKIAEERAEVASVRTYVADVEAYQRKKDALQTRIDIINQQKQRQNGPAAAIAKLSAVDPNGVQSVAVVGQELVVNRQ